MMPSKLQRMVDFRRVVFAFSGRVLPEFGISCGFYTLGRSNRFACDVAVVSSLLQHDDDAADCVIPIAKHPSRRTESIKPPTPKSP